MNKQAVPRYSLWLMPDKDTSAYFGSFIRHTASEFNSPRFEPHITLLGGFVAEYEQAVSLMRYVYGSMQETPTFSYSGLHVALEETRRIFARVILNEQLLLAHVRAKTYHASLIGPVQQERFDPHISLLYGSHDQSRIVHHKKVLWNDIQKSLMRLRSSGRCLALCETPKGDFRSREIVETMQFVQYARR